MADSQPTLALTRRYSCMYTRDVAKKAKTWHDGYINFHHRNSKCYLLDSDMVQLDECFLQPHLAGVTSMLNVPKNIKLPADTHIDFGGHKVTVEQLVYEEETDISKMYQKTRKDLDALDSLADAQVGGSHSTSKDARRHTSERNNERAAGSDDPFLDGRTFASPHYDPMLSAQRIQPPQSSHFGPMRTSNSGPTSLRADASRSTPQNCVINSRIYANTPEGQSRSTALLPCRTPKTSTPFRPPSFMGYASSGVDRQQTPDSASRRTLGTTRPSSLLAQRSLQSNWSKFTEATKAAQEPQAPRSSTAFIRIPQPAETEAEVSARRKRNLEQLAKQPEPVHVPVDQSRRDGQRGDTSSWMFD